MQRNWCVLKPTKVLAAKVPMFEHEKSWPASDLDE